MIGTGMTPPAPQGRKIELSELEIEALRRWHRIEALVELDPEVSRSHLVRADQLRRLLAGGGR